MLKDNIAYLPKFAPKEAYIDDLINGRLYMNATGYCHGLSGEQAIRSRRPWLPGCASTDILACPSTACIRSVKTISSTTP